MVRPKRFKRVRYAESTASSNGGNPHVPPLTVVPPLVIRVRPESPRIVPVAGPSGFVRPPTHGQTASVVSPAAVRTGPSRPTARKSCGVPLRGPAGGGRSGPFVVESFVRPTSPAASAFRPYVATVLPQPPPASPSGRGQSVGGMPVLVPIGAPTLVSANVSVSGCPTPVVSSEGSSSSSPLEPFDFETQYSLEANYLASLLTSEYLNRFVAFFFFFVYYITTFLSLFFFFFLFTFRLYYAGTHRGILRLSASYGCSSI